MSTGHVVPTRVYLTVFAALMILLVITVIVAFQPLGAFNMPVAMGIAVVKGIIIVMYFMEVKYGSKLLWVFVSSSFLFLVIFLVLTMNDYATRTWMTLPH
ncbi:MAG: cytochrome C oxidase subunit IV family protein [Blastocatellia bacterium]|nr:cytochrome C oxidase subunit IV family protein [Blastocatellia bacterium]